MANIITGIRILLSVALLFYPAFSPTFYALYIAAGFSDMIDGAVARKTGSVSEFGSRLDTIADIDVLTMGPICITPELKRNGYGKMLLDFSLEKAAEMGFGAVLFEGNIDFYGKSGFDYARKFGIRYHDLPEGADDSFFLCKELIPGYLDEVIGVYQTPQAYYVDDADVEEFDKNFPAKEKLKLPDQIFG